MAAVLLIGTLNRVMIVELGVPSWIVASDACAAAAVCAVAHTDRLSLRHITVLCSAGAACPIIWFGTMLQFGGLAIMPFALLLLSGDTTDRSWVGQAAAALAFLLVGAGLHTVQTVGLALATDLAPERAAAARRRAAVRDAARRHGGQRAAVRRAAAPFQRGAADPGRAGRGGGDDGAQCRRAVEAGSRAIRADPPRPRSPSFRRAWARLRATPDARAAV